MSTDPDAASADIEESIRAFLAAYHPNGRRGIDRIAATDNLWRAVDSLNMLLLVEFIEAKFEIRVSPIEFAPQHFSTIAAIGKFVAAKRAGERPREEPPAPPTPADERPREEPPAPRTRAKR